MINLSNYGITNQKQVIGDINKTKYIDVKNCVMMYCRLFDYENYSSLTSTIFGQADLKMSDMIMSKYDLNEAAKKYKFALIPKVYNSKASV